MLASGEAEIALGYETGTVPLAARPVFIRSADDAGRLVWEPYRSGGLARYVQRYIRDRRRARDFDPARARKVAVVARPCDARALVNYIKEKQFTRDDVYIVGVSCEGVADRAKVYERVGPYDLVAAAANDSSLVLTMRSGAEVKLALEEVLAPACARCVRRTPPLADVVVGPEVKAPDGDPYAVVAEHEKMSADERWAWFAAEMDRCIRCRACRQACPMCYCETCFADQTNPLWIGQTAELSDTMAFHIGRLFHMAGRCVDCGACEAACPMNIPLTVLNRKLDKLVYELYGYEPGLNVDEKPPLSTYSPDDPGEGFM